LHATCPLPGSTKKGSTSSEKRVINIAVAEMDKVVQEVAATAEESASASEEMNAQAFQMEHIVGDMIALVGAGEKGDVKDMATIASFDARLD